MPTADVACRVCVRAMRQTIRGGRPFFYLFFCKCKRKCKSRPGRLRGSSRLGYTKFTLSFTQFTFTGYSLELENWTQPS